MQKVIHYRIRKKLWLTKLGKYKGLGWYSSRVSSILLFIDTNKKNMQASLQNILLKRVTVFVL